MKETLKVRHRRIKRKSNLNLPPKNLLWRSTNHYWQTRVITSADKKISVAQLSHAQLRSQRVHQCEIDKVVALCVSRLWFPFTRSRVWTETGSYSITSIINMFVAIIRPVHVSRSLLNLRQPLSYVPFLTLRELLFMRNHIGHGYVHRNALW